LFKEQYTLVKLIDNEEEAAKYSFILREPVTNNSVDWDSIDIFHNEMEMVPEEEHFDFEDDLNKYVTMELLNLSKCKTNADVCKLVRKKTLYPIPRYFRK
jgi:hypothetical protein